MTDAKLIRLLDDDPNEGMRKLISKYSGLVFAVVRGVAGETCDGAEIEDCVADVFTRFYRGLPSFRQEASLKTYLGALARNAAKNMLRDRPPQTEESDLLLEIPDGSDALAEALEKELLRRVFDEIKRLGPPDAEIVFRKYYLGQSSKTVAAALGMTVSNVDVRAHRALIKLRAILGGEEI